MAGYINNHNQKANVFEENASSRPLVYEVLLILPITRDNLHSIFSSIFPQLSGPSWDSNSA